VVQPFRTAITRARGPLFKFLTEGSLQNTTGSRAQRMKLTSTKKGIENFLTGSLLEVRPMTIAKLQGLRPKVSTIDEWLSGDLREDVVGAIEQGASKMDDYLIVAISSEGTVRNGSGDTVKMELADILKGEYQAPHVSIWHYKLDDIDEVADPATWLKANPNLGKTVTYDVYHLDVERAEKAPASRNDILAKRFGIIRTSLRTKRPFLIVLENSGRCPVLWVQTSHKAMTSVLLLSCFQLVTMLSVSKLEVTSLI
jgi:phage terminase large subunit-like protein